MSASIDLIGIGLYTCSEAARLLHVRPHQLRRWMRGYIYSDRNKLRRWMEPLWTSDVPQFDNALELSFRDLVELRFVVRFVNAGLSLRTVRHALRAAQQIIGEERPFSTFKFKTDGRRVFLEIAHESSDPVVLDLRKSQYAFRQLIEPSFKDLDFEEGLAARWWPLSGRRSVVIDPQRSFGQPIDAEHGVPTAALANAAAVEGSIAAAARIFSVSPTVVRHAVEFEDRLAA